MHIISAADFPLFCSNSARNCLIIPAECSPQKSLIMREILLAEFIQAYPTVSSKLGNILQQKRNTVIKTEYEKNTTCFNLVKIHD